MDLQIVFITVVTYLPLQVKDINLTIGMNMVCGETIIQDVEGLSFEIHRSLRDLMHQLPAVEASIKVDHFL